MMLMWQTFDVEDNGDEHRHWMTPWQINELAKKVLQRRNMYSFTKREDRNHFRREIKF